MSAVIQYKCNNKECTFKTKKEADFPVWKSDSPKAMHKLPVGIRFKAYVAGYVDKQYCTSCMALRPSLRDSDMCLVCEKEGVFLKEDNKCPKCDNGTIKEDETKMLWF